MARVERSEGWTVAGSVSGVQAGLTGFLRAWGMRVVGEQTGETHARQGWWPARVLGPRVAAGPGGRPVRVGGRGVAVRAAIGEASPAAPLSPRVEDKYRAYFAVGGTTIRSAPLENPVMPQRHVHPPGTASARGRGNDRGLGVADSIWRLHDPPRRVSSGLAGWPPPYLTRPPASGLVI